MEGVSTVMPLAARGAEALDSLARSGRGGDPAAEARAEAVEAEARRRAESEQREAREQAGDLRESGQHRASRARVAAANSGLALSGSSLLSLEAQEHADDERIGELLGEAALRAQGILDAGAAQARSIRLSGRSRRGGSAGPHGLGSLLGLGGSVLERPWPAPVIKG